MNLRGIAVRPAWSIYGIRTEFAQPRLVVMASLAGRAGLLLVLLRRMAEAAVPLN